MLTSCPLLQTPARCPSSFANKSFKSHVRAVKSPRRLLVKPAAAQDKGASQPRLKLCLSRSCSGILGVQAFDCSTDRGPFDEGAAQVKKLLTRDKRELMGVEQIGQRARTEFDEEDNKPSTSGSDNGTASKENTRLFGEGQCCVVKLLCHHVCSSNKQQTGITHRQLYLLLQAGTDQSQPVRLLGAPAKVQSELQTLLVQTVGQNHL